MFLLCFSFFYIPPLGFLLRFLFLFPVILGRIFLPSILLVVGGCVISVELSLIDSVSDTIGDRVGLSYDVDFTNLEMEQWVMKQLQPHIR